MSDYMYLEPVRTYYDDVKQEHIIELLLGCDFHGEIAYYDIDSRTLLTDILNDFHGHVDSLHWR